MKANSKSSLGTAAVLLCLVLVPVGEAGAGQPGPVSLEYYGEIGCSHCDTFEESALPAAAARAGVTVELVLVDILSAEGYEKCRKRLADFGQEFRVFPVLVLGNNAYQGNSAIEANLEAELSHYAREGVFRPRRTVGPGPSGFRPGLWPVFLAGLVDGINPCAFTTLLFFLSFVSLRGGSRGRIAAAGLLFAAGVFLAYLLIGLGLLNVLRAGLRVSALRLALRILVTGITAAYCVLTLRDIALARRGRLSEASLRLPDAVRSRINASIRGGVRSAVFPLGVFLSGAAVAVLELACTGQVYFPTLSYLAQTGAGLRGMGGLLLYNLAFILPLLAVLALILMGTSQERIREFFRRRVILAKAALALTFAILAVLVWIY